MATYTTNLNLKKPATTDNYNVDDQNGNMDIIDGAINVPNGIAGLDSDSRIAVAQLPTNFDFSATNIVTNGDFSNGTTGWLGDSSIIGASSNVLSVTNSGAEAGGGAKTTTDLLSAIGKKIYIKAVARVTNAVSTNLFIYTYNGASVQIAKSISTPEQNTWYPLSGVVTEPEIGTSNIKVYIKHQYADAATATGKVMEVQYVLAIDLTAIFGAGNEPTAAEMDAILAFYPNSWFDGTVNLASNSKMLPYLLNATRNRPIMTTGTYAARPTSVIFPTLYLSTDKAAGNVDRLTLNVGGSTWLQI